MPSASPHYVVHDREAVGPPLAQVRETARAMLADGAQEEAFEFVLAALAAVLSKSRDLELLVAKLRRVGRSSERLDPGQLALLFEELAEQLGTEDEQAPDVEEQARQDAALEHEIEEEKRARPAKAGSKRGRGWRTRNVRLEVHQIPVAPEECACPHCGGPTRRIGTDKSRELDYVPGHFVEREYHHEKRACGKCKWGVTTAPSPKKKVIERSAASGGLLAHVVVSKYADHTPLHRLHRIYERTGATIPVSTLSDWVRDVAECVTPLVDRIAERVVDGAYVVRTDATGLGVLDPSSPANIERGTIWCMVGDDTDVVFRYTPTGEGASGPWTFLADRRGYIQADAASVLDRLYNGQVSKAIEVGCWAHYSDSRIIPSEEGDVLPGKGLGRLRSG